MRIGVLTFAVAAAFAASVAGAAGAKHVVEEATSGAVRAVFSYDFHSPYRFTNAHLTIARGGTAVLDVPVKPVASYGEVVPNRYSDHRKSVFVRDLDGDGEPEVLLDLYWGGAHCCWYVELFRYVAAAERYQRVVHVFWNQGYRLADLNRDGLQEFISGDNRFAYEFTSFAASSWPLQIWTYQAGLFRDTTRRFPARIRTDAARQWRLAVSKKNRQDNTGLLAAWAGEECLLRHCGAAFRRLEAMRLQGRIGHGWDATPRRYLKHLRRFLGRTGYLR